MTAYINWLYFFHAWGFPARLGSIARVHGCTACRQNWLMSFPEAERSRAGEAMKLYDDALRLLTQMDETYATHGRVALCDANADGDDIVLVTSGDDEERIALLRQQVAGTEGYCMCLSDFVRPLSQGIRDRVGLFVATADKGIEEGGCEDDYHHMLHQTLADRLAEATAERIHEEVRRNLWAYAPNEHLTPEEMFAERYQGKRPAVGYPSLPDQSLNFQLSRLLDFASLGVTLTETGSMRPHGSTSGLMLAHPACRHFDVGAISEEQLLDYAHRKGIEASRLRPYLAANL